MRTEPHNGSITRSRGSGKTQSLTHAFASKTGQLIERGARVGCMQGWAAVKSLFTVFAINAQWYPNFQWR